MRLTRSILVRVGRSATVRAVRRLLGRAVAPGLNPSFELVHSQHRELHLRLDRLERKLDDYSDRLSALELTKLRLDDVTEFLSGRIASIDDEFPALLNAMNSANGTARLLRRELDERLSEVKAELQEIVGMTSSLAAPAVGNDRAELSQ